MKFCTLEWPEFHTKHINFRIMCSNRIDTREGSEWGTVYWDQIGTNRIQIQIKRWNHWRTPGWSEHTAQLVFTQSHKYTVDNVHRENETDQIHPPIPLLDMFLQFEKIQRQCTLLLYFTRILYFLCIGLFSPIITISNQVGCYLENNYC